MSLLNNFTHWRLCMEGNLDIFLYKFKENYTQNSKYLCERKQAPTSMSLEVRDFTGFSHNTSYRSYTSRKASPRSIPSKSSGSGWGGICGWSLICIELLTSKLPMNLVWLRKYSIILGIILKLFKVFTNDGFNYVIGKVKAYFVFSIKSGEFQLFLPLPVYKHVQTSHFLQELVLCYRERLITVLYILEFWY